MIERHWDEGAMTTRRHAVCCALAFAAFGLSPRIVQAALAPSTPDETVKRLFSLPHGLTWESGEIVEILLSRVRADPDAHVPLLLAAFDPEQVRLDSGEDALGRAYVAAETIVKAGGDAGRTQLATKVGDLLRATAKEQARLSRQAAALERDDARSIEGVRQERRTQGIALQLAVGSVTLFLESGDARLVNAVVEVLGAHDRITRGTLCRYLGRTARGDVAVAAELESRWLTPATSPIRDDPDLTRTILVIRRSAPPETPPATPKERVERLLTLPAGMPPAPEDAMTLREAAAEPEAHFAALEAALGRFEPVSLQGTEATMRFESAAALLGALGTEAAATRLGEWFIRLDAAARDGADSSRRAALLQMRDMALEALGPWAPPAVKEHVLANLAKMDPAGRRKVYGYLLRCCRGDTVVGDGLGRLRAAEGSELRKDPAFVAFLSLFQAEGGN
jgi:hypothetical protein